MRIRAGAKKLLLRLIPVELFSYRKSTFLHLKLVAQTTVPQLEDLSRCALYLETIDNFHQRFSGTAQVRNSALCH